MSNLDLIKTSADTVATLGDLKRTQKDANTPGTARMTLLCCILAFGLMGPLWEDQRCWTMAICLLGELQLSGK